MCVDPSPFAPEFGHLFQFPNLPPGFETGTVVVIELLQNTAQQISGGSRTIGRKSYRYAISSK